MSYAEFQEHWEREAEGEGRLFAALSLVDLLQRLRARQLGSYYRIWYAIAEKQDVRIAAPALLAELSSDLEYLHRYHCAQALLSMLPYTGLRAVDVSDRTRAAHSMYLAELDAAVRQATAAPSSSDCE